jgi:hypothetical protein
MIAAMALLAGPQAAFGQERIGPAADQYEPTPQVIEQSVGGGGNESCDPGDPGCGEDSSTARVVSGLPFTGLDLGLLAAVAALLGITGVVVKRLAAASHRL